MRFHWPPSEEKNWRFETIKEKQNKPQIFFPFQKHNYVLLGVRIQAPIYPVGITLPIAEGKAFHLEIKDASWQMLPYPIESHTIDSIWQPLELDSENCTVDFAYYPWENRQFRMRALTDSRGVMLLAYRINKKGQTVIYLAPKDHSMKLPEDTYILPPTSLIHEKSIILLSAQSSIEVKKAPESRYFLV